MACNWSNLPKDMLHLIAGKIRTLEDFMRFAAVCSNWRTVLMKEEGPIFHRPQLPWLMLSYDDHGHDDGHGCQCECQPECRMAFSLMENKVHHLAFSEAYGKKCVGTSHGWLVMVEDVSPSVFILNPLTKRRIDLPPITTMPNILGFNKEDVGYEYIHKSFFDGEISRMSLKTIEEYFIRKVILSNDPEAEDCIVVALYGQLRQLVFCKIGDNSWTQVKYNLQLSQSDVIYNKGKFYVVNHNGKVGVLEDIRNPHVTIIQSPQGLNLYNKMYLAVDTDGTLLHISRRMDMYDSLSDMERDSDDGSEEDDDDDNNDIYNNDDDDDEGPIDYNDSSDTSFYLTKEFDVFKLDEEKNEWNKVSDIGENIVFLGDNQSVCYSTTEFPECRKNSIYFTDDYWEHKETRRYGGHDIGIFNIEEGGGGLIKRISCFKEGVPLLKKFPRPIWFTPSSRKM